MADPNFFQSVFYMQICECQRIIDNLNQENFDDSLQDFIQYTSTNNLKTIASSLLNRIKIKPQDVNLVIDFIERHDEIKNHTTRLDTSHSILMPTFASIINPMPLFSTESDELVHFTAVPVSECFIYENLRQRGHIKFNLEEYYQLMKMKEKMPHLFPSYCSYEICKDFSFLKTVQYIHIMPKPDYIEFISKPDLKSFLKEYDEIDLNDFEKHAENLLTGFNPSELPTYIRTNNYEALKDYVQNSMNFNFTQKIKLSIYDCNILLKDSNLLEYAAYYGSANCFQFIYENAPNAIELFTPKLFQFAVIGGDTDIINFIEQQFKSIHSNDPTELDPFSECLPYSLAFHHKDISEWLINFNHHTYDIDIYRGDGSLSTTLNCFYFANWRDMIYLLRSENYIKNASMFLLAAAMFNNNEIFRNLIEFPNIDLNIKYDIMGPINFLVRFDNHEMIKLLLDKAKMLGKKLDINQNGFSNVSPLMYSCFYQLFESYKVLIQHEDVNVNFGYRYNEEYDETDHYFNVMTICLKYRQFKMARMAIKHPKFSVNETKNILENEPYNHNMVLSLNYLLNEKKKKKRKNTKTINTSGFDD